MLIFICFCAIVGIVVGTFSGISILGWIAAGLLFICGLPFLLIQYTIYGFIDHSHDRDDYRQLQSDLAADLRAEERGGDTYIDNRQVHIRGYV